MNQLDEKNSSGSFNDAVDSYSREAFTEEEMILDKSCVRKMDYTVLPICALFYFLSFLDRSNIGNAKVAGLATDLNLTSTQYLICITVTYVPYIAAELPMVLLLKSVGASRMLPTLVTLWGVVCVFQGLVQGYSGLIAARFFLGLLEGGLFPGLVLYLSMFYKRAELQLRVALFFSAASLSGAFSGLLAAAIINMNGVGGQQGWRWIFFIEGLFTVACGIVCLFLMPAMPADSKFLSAEQKKHILRRMALDKPEGAGEEPPFSWKECGRALTSIHVLLLLPALFATGVNIFGYGYFTPTIVAGFKYNTITTQLLTVPPYVVAFIITMFSAYYSDKYGRRSYSTLIFAFSAVIGYSLFYVYGGTTNVAGKYTSLFFGITGAYGMAPSLSTWVPNNSAHHYRKATAIISAFVMTNSGGILSTWLFPATEGPAYSRGTLVNLGCAVSVVVFTTLNLIWLMRANKQKAAQREAIKSGSEPAGDWQLLGDKHPDYIYTY